MRLRLNGTEDECAAYVAVFRQAFDVLDVSRFNPWTRHDPHSKLGAVYVTLELPSSTVIRATAERLPELPAADRRRRLGR